MLRRLHFRSRSFLAMLLTFCLVNASLWGYSAEAMADALSDEIVIAAVHGDSDDHPATEKACNHGCHAQTHLTGLDSSVPALSAPDITATFIIERAIDVPTQPGASPFRPPRNTFQA